MAEGTGAIYLYNDFVGTYLYGKERVEQCDRTIARLTEQFGYAEDSGPVLELEAKRKDYAYTRDYAANEMVRLANTYRSVLREHNKRKAAGEFGSGF